jgi:hypothetical protein
VLADIIRDMLDGAAGAAPHFPQIAQPLLTPGLARQRGLIVGDWRRLLSSYRWVGNKVSYCSEEICNSYR